MLKVMLVCHGNICRSPMAEFILKDLAKKAGIVDKLSISSSATSTEEIGSTIHSGTKNVLNKHGIPFNERFAVQLKKSDYEEFDYLIGMDTQNLRNMKRIVGEDKNNKVYRLLDFTNNQKDVEDPWYTNDFDKTYNDILEGCTALILILRDKTKSH